MTGYECICEAINIFETSLRNAGRREIVRTVSQLAELTGYSVYHFTRLFFTVTGYSPKEYMAGRIFSEVAQKIVESDFSLKSIAYDFGFDEYETFSRGFKRFFGVPPRSVRSDHSLPAGYLKRVMPEFEKGTGNLLSDQPEIVEMDAHYLTGLPFYIEAGTTSFHKQWAIFMNVQEQVSGRLLPELYCQYSSWTDNESVSGLSILCAIETVGDVQQNPFFYTRRVPPASYLRFRHNSEVSDLWATYTYIYHDWFASHEVKPVGSWECQRYVDKGETIEICIPIALHEEDCRLE